jgi:hypothetical protein
MVIFWRKGEVRKRGFIALFMFFSCLNVFPQMFSDESLKKRYIIATSNMDIVKKVVADYCIRFNMKQSNLNIYSGQELLYVGLLENDHSKIMYYCAVFTIDNKIYIDFCDSSTWFKTKWFDNFPGPILWELNRNNITYNKIIN